ncbi:MULTISPECIES: lipid asymmetry maintenance protein MlaB [unclassified Brenneria]|uniref:lipid asymmetry maintenance protein MlaB n=1 Tax=unclassified Brenneria TaxID=2634434 RepID=UPI001556ECB1|nr:MULTISPECIES: lipid asymmetry maintenance protein MlaB [unclassified Brenneria]MBJ7222474.1 lipid asymmetry maintenance protein MlaB [Brenneria sp. L3-3C-1]MEE3643717.1 lipid asymmetry maintenance protein MlaB [Brenneria sp. L3_3C_1]MEE3651445.1 lipid asymmetry maintenance protein MlaB [Brenneria sp. HEZEL_4_2_4]NPD01401.1 lipid asymmetry maintenance protein MlaB [Brenneria sp. hezel4-2-4]
MANALNWQSQQSTLILSGALDRETLLSLWRQRDLLLADKTSLDVSGLDRVDSAGLALLIHFYYQQSRQGVELKINGAGDRLKTLIALYNLNEIIPVS